MLNRDDEWSVDDEEFDPNKKYSNSQMEQWADKLLKDDSNRELCRRCDGDGVELPYGEETGHVEPRILLDENGDPQTNEDDHVIYADFPELECEQGHRWFKGEGKRRHIQGPNPILFKDHIDARKKREIYVQQGYPDPAIKAGIYNRIYPHGGRKVNTDEQRSKNGASFYR